ncbi:amino acid permease [Candidatus Woesearchaeota archaeon]|nr:amino acid permease [Candidatus Woesearchaeota archaeon]
MAELKQSLGYWTLLSLSISAVAGSTLFFGASIGAGISGNMLIIALIPLSMIALYVAGCFGELTSMFPTAGGSYEFGKQAYGRFISFVIGWTAWLVGNITIVVSVVGALKALLPDAGVPIMLGLSVAIIFFLNIIAYVGMEAGSKMLIAFAVITVAIPVTFIIMGVPSFNAENFTPFLTHSLSTAFVAIFFMLETFFGWEEASFLAEETKNPRRVIPRAIMHSTIIICLLVIALSVLTLGIVGWERLAEMGSPLTQIAGQIFGKAGSGFISAGIFITLIGSAAGMVIAMPRLLLAMARDKLFLGQFKEIHPRFKTPYKAVFFQTFVIIVILFMGLGSYNTLLSLFVPLALIMYMLLIATVSILRFKKPDMERQFRVPAGKVGPLIVVAIFAGITVMWVLNTVGAEALLWLSISIVGIGLPLYLLVELYYDPKAIIEVNDLLAYATLLTEKFTYPKHIRDSVLTFLEPVKGKTILEFGCGVGTLTMSLLKEIGPRGSLYATHFSKNYIRIAKKRVERAKWETEGLVYGKAFVIHDPEHFNRVHPDVEYADVVVSVGMLGYIHDFEKVLKELWAIMPVGGKICFVEYSDFFHLIPNVEWLSSDRMIEKIFRDAGFSVKVVREKSLLWNRIFLYGIKFTKDIAFI